MRVSWATSGEDRLGAIRHHRPLAWHGSEVPHGRAVFRPGAVSLPRCGNVTRERGWFPSSW